MRIASRDPGFAAEPRDALRAFVRPNRQDRHTPSPMQEKTRRSARAPVERAETSDQPVRSRLVRSRQSSPPQTQEPPEPRVSVRRSKRGLPKKGGFKKNDGQSRGKARGIHFTVAGLTMPTDLIHHYVAMRFYAPHRGDRRSSGGSDRERKGKRLHAPPQEGKARRERDTWKQSFPRFQIPPEACARRA